MNHTLVTFLGRGRTDTGIGYQTTTYRFPDGQKKTTASFGLALAKYIQPKPDRIVILGTSGSQWGVLVEGLAGTTSEGLEARLDLLDAEAKHSVNQVILDRVRDLVCRAVGNTVFLRQIPLGRDDHTQYRLLEIIAENVGTGTVSLDLTHGFRHFGMIGFLSAFMLERVRDLDVCELWYGARDMTQDGITPVIRLDGLKRVQRWLDAFGHFDATGDYGEFAELLLEDKIPKGKVQSLKDAAFYERTLNLAASVQKVSTFLPELDQPLAGASGLFQNRLAERLAWARPAALSEQQGRLAQQYLKRRDYLRAVLFGWEALVTRECELKGRDPRDRNARTEQDVLRQLQSRCTAQPEIHTASSHLNQIRNALAHGTPPRSPDSRRMLKSETSLGDGLREAFETLKVG